MKEIIEAITLFVVLVGVISWVCSRGDGVNDNNKSA